MFVDSNVSEGRPVSVLMNEGRSGEVALLGENEKGLVKVFKNTFV